MSSLLVIGLGNPGKEYERTRHNVGAATVGLLASRHHTTLSVQKNAKARVATVHVAGVRMVIAIPMTFMNNSGEAAAPLVRHYLVDEDEPLRHLIVVHDELDLAPGTVRLKFGGGTAGHNGLKSLGAHLHGYDFGRIRIGVGKPPGSMSGADYVLRRLSGVDQELIGGTCEIAADAIELIAKDGFERAMNALNTR
jgi:PTH1 family peptidyl-tRNA hydrolase